MVQRRSSPGLTLEPFDPVGIHGYVRPKHFDGDDAAKARVARSVDLAHASCAEWLENLVRSKTRAGSEGHRR
jgi:hypothetical protein